MADPEDMLGRCRGSIFRSCMRCCVRGSGIAAAVPKDMLGRYRGSIFWLCMLWFLSGSGVAAAAPQTTLHAVNSTVVDLDLAALAAMKAALTDQKGILQTWNIGEGNACGGAWAGVRCHGGRIVFIHLPSKGLGGQLAAEIGLLSSLRQLSLHTNAIAGSIPSSFANLRSLRGLYLFRNLLIGSVPASLSPVLEALDLSNNRLSGPIPEGLSTSALLRLINLSFNNLSSTIPTSISSLSRLEDILLSHNQLTGAIPSLSPIASLQTLDLSQNLLTGSFPGLQQGSTEATIAMAAARQAATPSPSMEPFPSLRFLNLSRNALSGKLPTQIGEISKLLQLDVSSNKFSGSVPPQLAKISELSVLDISHNGFTGNLPPSLALLTNFTQFNCSFNSLTGKVPEFTHKFQPSAFMGNKGLCGFSSGSGCELSLPPKSNNSRASQEAEAASTGQSQKKLSALSIVFIVVGIVILLFFIVCLCSLLFICCCRRASQAIAKAGFTGEEGQARGNNLGEAAKKEAVAGGKLVHFEGSLRFAADDLLCATAEVVGKSTYGTVYKAMLEDGNQVAVKRLREGIVKSQLDFEIEVTALGAVRHPNLLALRAYYWGPKNEKLLIFDFMEGGSLAAFVHARGSETPLTWQMRMKIAVGAAKGLVYLHGEQNIIHGNLTSSNILIDAHQNAKLSDFGLSRLMTPAANSNVIATAGTLGYRAPELTKLRKATTKSDVYSFGIVLLELLTGKAPGEAPSLGGMEEGAMDLPEWVSSIVKKDLTQEVFDVELMKGRAPGDEELVITLQLAMNCVKLAPFERPEMSEVLQQLEKIKPDLKE